MSQNDFARVVGVDRRTAERWESGATGIRGRNVARIAETLCQPVDVIRAHLKRESEGGQSDTGVARAIQVPSLETGSADDLVTGPSFAPQLLATLDHYAAMDNMHGPLGLIPLLVQQTNHAIDLIRLTPPSGQPDVIYAAARLAEFTGWLYQDAGDTGSAMHWTNAGVDLATEAGDSYLVAYMWMRKANVALDARKPRMVLEFAAEAGRRATHLTPKLRASNLRVEAQALAIQGDGDRSAKAIDRAMIEAAEPFDGEIDLAVYCTTGYIEMEAANCWLELGKPEAALGRLAEEVEAWDPRFRRDRAMSLARLAHAQVKAGDTLAGMETALLAADTNRAVQSGRVRDRLELVVAELFEQGGDESLVRELRSILVVLPEIPAKEIVKSWI